MENIEKQKTLMPIQEIIPMVAVTLTVNIRQSQGNDATIQKRIEDSLKDAFCEVERDNTFEKPFKFRAFSKKV